MTITVTRIERDDLHDDLHRRGRNRGEVAADGEVVRASIFMMDSVQRAVAAATHPILHAPRSGRFTDEQNAARNAAIAAYEARLCEAWKSPAPVLDASVVAGPPAPAPSGDGMTLADHRANYESRLRNAWRGPNKEHSND